MMIMVEMIVRLIIIQILIMVVEIIIILKKIAQCNYWYNYIRVPIK